MKRAMNALAPSNSCVNVPKVIFSLFGRAGASLKDGVDDRVVLSESFAVAQLRAFTTGLNALYACQMTVNLLSLGFTTVERLVAPRRAQRMKRKD